MYLIVLSEKWLDLITGNLLLLSPPLKQYSLSVDKIGPLSLTDIFAKIAEGFISKWVVQDIQDSIDINQFGDIHGVSSANYQLNLMYFLFQGAVKPKNIRTLVLTDFSKAFDLVNHSVAIQNLIDLRVQGTSWIGLSLTNKNSISLDAKPCRFASCVTLLLI